MGTTVTVKRNGGEAKIKLDRRGRIATFTMPTRPLFDYTEETWSKKLAKLALDAQNPKAASNQRGFTGLKAHPFDMEAVTRFMSANTHHSSCILTKRDSTTGLGLKNDKQVERLDELCERSWLDLMNMVGDDFWQTGNAYIEVVRGGGGKEITGLHHIPASTVQIFVESVKRHEFYYSIQSRENATTMKFAAFGDLDEFIARQNGAVKREDTSEVIHFRQASSLSRWYGVPNWLSAVACIELVMAILQHNYDFFNNRGVPEFLLFIMGEKVNKVDWDKLESALSSHVGLGNAFKSSMFNLTNPGTTVQLEKLNVDGGNTEASFQAFLDTLSLLIVSAHRVPPLLAQIQIPGKLGANNELPNAMAAFQALVIGPAQKTFSQTLGTTLGHSQFGLKKGIRGAKSFEWNTILEHVNIQQMAATASSRTPVGPKQPGSKVVNEAASKAVAKGMMFAIKTLSKRAKRAGTATTQATA